LRLNAACACMLFCAWLTVLRCMLILCISLYSIVQQCCHCISNAGQYMPHVVGSGGPAAAKTAESEVVGCTHACSTIIAMIAIAAFTLCMRTTRHIMFGLCVVSELRLLCCFAKIASAHCV
jgi:hypothetical protein